MSNRITNLLANLRVRIIHDSNGAALFQATEAIELLDARLDDAEKTIAWLKSCKEGNSDMRNFSRRMPQPGDTMRILGGGWEVTPGPDEGKKNPDAPA